MIYKLKNLNLFHSNQKLTNFVLDPTENDILL